MLRGELSNEPVPVVLIDYRVLLDQQKPYSWMTLMIPRLLLQAGFSSMLKYLLPLREGAIEWLARNRHRNLEVFSIGVPLLIAGIDEVLEEYVACIRHFDSVADLRFWLLTNTQVVKVLTADQSLLDSTDTFQLFTGWTEKV